MKMKSLQLLSLLLLSGMFVTAGDGGRDFVIRGHFRKVKQGKIFLLQQASLVQRSKYPGAYLQDSAVIADGKFQFKGKIGEDVVEVFFTMRLPVSDALLAADPLAGHQTLYGYLSGGEMVMSGNDLSDVVISGSPERTSLSSWTISCAHCGPPVRRYSGNS